MCRQRHIPEKAPKPSTPPSPPTASPGEKRAALESHRILTQNLTSLQNQIQSAGPGADSLSALLANSSHHLDTLGQYLSATVEPLYYHETLPLKPSSPSTAHRTLAIPELFELILDYLSIPSILSLSQTCQEYKSRIAASAHLQARLCLSPAPVDSKVRTPFRSCFITPERGGFYCKAAPGGVRSSVKFNAEGVPTMEIVAAFYPYGPEQKLPRIGSTYRRMFLTQPPIRTLTPHLRCCTQDHPEPITREDGIRIGDIYDIAAELIEKHRWCPNAPARCMMDNGQNRGIVQFQGQIELCETDPVVKKHVREVREKEAERHREQERRKMLGAYSVVKRDTHGDGHPVPTMQEWLATNPVYGQEPPMNPHAQIVAAALAATHGVTIANDAFSFN